MNFGIWPQCLLVVDVEGNGALPPDIVELAAVPVAEGRVRSAEAKSTLIRPHARSPRWPPEYTGSPMTP
jgi:exodeoxyribonuclease X